MKEIGGNEERKKRKEMQIIRLKKKKGNIIYEITKKEK